MHVPVEQVAFLATPMGSNWCGLNMEREKTQEVPTSSQLTLLPMAVTSANT